MSTTLSHPDKKALRAALRAARAGLSAAERRHAARRVERLASRLGLLKPGRRIGFYIPAKGELDILPLLERARVLGVNCFLPIVPGRGYKKLWFSPLGEQEHLWRVNRFGIPEYQGWRRKRVRASRLDLIFVPLLGFDACGHRIGMGGGYYDSSLAFLNRRQWWRRPRLVGVAFDVQRVERVPADPWDVRLDRVITERGAYRCDGGSPR